MYQGLDKSSGDIVGSKESQLISIEFNDICDNTSVEEILICQEEDENGNIQKIYACSELNQFDGTLNWIKSYNESFILNKTIGMSQMTSMLHDIDRNNVYENSIQFIIQNFIKKYNRSPTVLDIGTGTGLLAMMCIRHGAEYVIGCEMFEALAEVARQVIQENNYSDKILIVSAKSCDIDALPFSPDIIISELLDSALLGEGVLFSHQDAIIRFLDHSLTSTEDSNNDNDNNNIEDRVIPHSAVIYGTLVESIELSRMWSLSESLCVGEGLSTNRKIIIDDEDESEIDIECKGTEKDQEIPSCQWSRMIPVHWNEQFDNQDTKLLTDSIPLVSVEFFHDQLENTYQNVIKMTILKNGIIHGLFCWWNVNLISPKFQENITYTTKPGHHKWQDHWQQVVIPFPGNGIQCYEGDIINIVILHDGLRIWSQIQSIERVSENDLIPFSKKPKYDLNLDDINLTFPECTCGWHLLCSVDRLLALNDHNIMSKWNLGMNELSMKILDKRRVNSNTPMAIFDTSDGSTLSFMLSSHLSKQFEEFDENLLKIVSLERKQFSSLFYSQLVESNKRKIHDLLMIVDSDDWNNNIWKLNENETEFFPDIFDDISLTEQPSVLAVISECFYYQLHSNPMMSALSFLYSLRQIYEKNQISILKHNILVCPVRAHIMIAPFELLDLHVSHGQAGMVSGFDHTPLDIVQNNWHENLFPYKLGIYRKKILAEPICIGTIHYNLLSSGDYSKLVNYHDNAQGFITTTGILHCMAIWVDYDVTDTINIKYWNGNNFPSYLKTPIKFSQVPTVVDHDTHKVDIKSFFQFGDSEIKFDFSISSRIE